MENFFIVINNEQKGPFSVKEILEMDIHQKTLVWNENYDDWTELNNIEQFKTKLSKKPPPIPLKNKEEPLKIILTKEKTKRIKINYEKIFESLFKLASVSLVIGILTALIYSFIVYDISKFDNYDYSKVTMNLKGGSSVGYNFPLDEYSPYLDAKMSCTDDGKFKCLKYNVKKRKESIIAMSVNKGLITFGISYLIIVLIYFTDKHNRKEK
ncbi:DUF4339 domain-containing protein [Tenacibaculum dicentrarchi]|nr:DUF4339 domain-containing protein [Tenacibaculum dicentrarchi]MCD8426022.1 DUF4339 domain-containing protein [Tenacibaculum dicentrarchi]MCD8443259.1 DUF4339 domain-containing protein [Tenacibaculum dicentrarchi]